MSRRVFDVVDVPSGDHYPHEIKRVEREWVVLSVPRIGNRIQRARMPSPLKDLQRKMLEMWLTPVIIERNVASVDPGFLKPDCRLP